MRRERTRGKTSAFVRATAASALVVPLAAALVACGSTAKATDPAPSPVRIGAIYNLTGDQSALDGPSLDGARLAVDRINARGGLMGRRVELLERDGQTNETDVMRAAASLVASGCSAIIGLSDTDQVLAAAPIAARAGVPFVTSGATSPRLTKQVPNWLFLACFGDNAQAAASAQFATDQLGARTAAIVYDEDMDYTRLLAKYFERSFRAQGGNVVAAAEYKRAAEAVPRLETADDTGADTGSSTSDGSGAGGGESSGDASAGSNDGAGQGSSSESGGDGGASSTSTATGAGTKAATSTRTSPARSADVLFVAAGPADAARVVRRLRAAGYDQPIMGGDSFDSAVAHPGRGEDRRQGLLHHPRRRRDELGEPRRAPLRRVVPGGLRTAAGERLRLTRLRRDRFGRLGHQARRLREAGRGPRRPPGDAPLPRRDRDPELPRQGPGAAQEGDRRVRGATTGGRRPVHAGLRSAALTGRRRQFRPKIARK